MKYAPTVTPVTDLMDAGIPPALAAALHVVASIALATVADGCNHLARHGATVDEVEAYRMKATDELGAWVMRHVPAVTAGVQLVIDERVAMCLTLPR